MVKGCLKSVALVASLILAACSARHETEIALPREIVGNITVANLTVDLDRPRPGAPAYVALNPGLSGEVAKVLQARFDKYAPEGAPVDVHVALTGQSHSDANDVPTVSGTHRLQAILEVREAGSGALIGRYQVEAKHSSFGPMMLTQSESSALRHRKAIQDFALEVDRILNLDGFGV